MIRGSCKSPKCPADKVRTQASFHANDTARQLLERIFESQSPDLSAKSDLPISAKADEMKYILADVHTNHCQRCCVGRRLRFHHCFSCSS
jgi:hypothetical protein